MEQARQPPVDGSPLLGLAVSHDSSQSLVEAHGDLDLATAADLDAALTGASRDGHAKTVIVDLQWLTFCDAAGLALLVSHHYALQRARGHLVIMRPPPQLERLITLNRLEDVLDVRCPGRPSSAQFEQ